MDKNGDRVGEQKWTLGNGDLLKEVLGRGEKW